MIEPYPTDRLYEEVAFIAYHFNWDRDRILDLPHAERQRWCEEISDINEEMNQGVETPKQSSSDRTTITQKPEFFQQ